jgi:N-acetylgalactosamine kinase
MQSPVSQTPIASIVLCAGKGRRMKNPRTPKVCLPIGGTPAIVLLLETLRTLRVDPMVLVVGHRAEAVKDVVRPRFPEARFVLQSRQLGTGHAARQGAASLFERSFRGAVLVLAGDKVIAPRAFRKLIEVFRAEKPAQAVLVSPYEAHCSSGCVVTDQAGRMVRIIEAADLREAESRGDGFDIEGITVAARELRSRIAWVNQGMYLFPSDVLSEALSHLGRDNIQQEEYLTDTVHYLAQSGRRVIPVPVDGPDDVMSFNTPAELLRVEKRLLPGGAPSRSPRRPVPGTAFQPPGQWARRLRANDVAVQRMLRAAYGSDPALIERRRVRLLEAVELFLDRFGTTGNVVVVRAPGRLNLMGRHIDHRGGPVNMMALDREQILVARPRADSIVRARNAEPTGFPDREFHVDDVMGQLPHEDWDRTLSHASVVDLARDRGNDWANYLRAPLLRLQCKFRRRELRGLDCVVCGDIPRAAGLSSSSALVIAMAEAIALANRLAVTAEELIDLCGEAEWFVGTRGGAGDHAAIKLSRVGQVVHVGFAPLTIHGDSAFPPDHVMIVCDSRIPARKSADVQEVFNERIVCCALATHLVRARFPRHAQRIEYLRDINPEQLGIGPDEIYRILKGVPESASADSLRTELGRDVFERLTADRNPQEAYALRGRLLFGIAECERSRRCPRLLREGRMTDLGRLMTVSHDGDRVIGPDGRPFVCPINDAAIDAHIRNLSSEDDQRRSAVQLWMQPGAYGCSLPQLDAMVDIALTTPGVLGAQLSGAGLGGCIMVLVRSDAVNDLTQRVGEGYYEPENVEPRIFPATPAAGCGPLMIDFQNAVPGKD